MESQREKKESATKKKEIFEESDLNILEVINRRDTGVILYHNNNFGGDIRFCISSIDPKSQWYRCLYECVSIEYCCDAQNSWEMSHISGMKRERERGGGDEAPGPVQTNHRNLIPFSQQQQKRGNNNEWKKATTMNECKVVHKIGEKKKPPKSTWVC